MKIKLARDDKNSNYKVKLKDIKKEKEFIKLLEDYNTEYKKTEYFKNFFTYNLKNINSKFIMLLQEKASNYIEYIEPMSVYSLPIRIDKEEGEIPVIFPEENKKYVTLGIVDNGVASIKNLTPWIKKIHTRFLKEETSATHGTFVAGLSLYGDALENKKIVVNEGFYLLDATVLSATTIEEDELLKNIILAIKENYKKVKIWNLSLSVKLEIEEESFSDFGVVLDYLQKKYSVLIFKSGGNCGGFMKKKSKGRLYHGSDSLMSMVVSSVTNDGEASNYSRLGLGPYNTIKPDIASFGGNLSLGKNGEMVMTGVKSFSANGDIASSSGTSFATARMSGLGAILYQNLCEDFDNFSDFDATLIKALIIHSAKNTEKNLKIEEIGFGIPATSTEILSYIKNENIKIFRDNMKKIKIYDLNKIFTGYKRNFRIKVTLVYETEFDFYQKSEYIKSDIKIRNFSEDGRNLIRKFEINVDKNENLELFSDNDIEKKYTLIIEKL